MAQKSCQKGHCVFVYAVLKTCRKVSVGGEVRSYFNILPDQLRSKGKKERKKKRKTGGGRGGAEAEGKPLRGTRR